MYNRTLRIALFGLEDGAVEAIRSIAPPARFAFEFETSATVDLELARRASLVVCELVALGDTSLADLAAAAHEGAYGYHGLAVCAAPDDIATWDPATYELLDAIWPTPLSAPCAKFMFTRVVERAKAQADAYINGAYLNTLIDSMPEMVWFKALDGEHVKVNSYFCDIVDKTREDVTGQFHNYIWSVPEEDWEKAELTCKESDDVAINAGTTTRCDELVSTHGEIRTFDTYKTPIYDEDGSILGTSGFAHDVTVERELEKLAWLNARTDYLTGLYNRRYFYEYLEEHEADGPMTYVLVDLDNFKGINDGSGHDEGDNALLVTTAVLRKCFPECPVVRWGGDEFIVIVPHANRDLADDQNIVDLLQTLREWTAEKCPFALEASVGIANQEPGMSVDAAVKHADDALYEAKKAGKARHVRHA